METGRFRRPTDALYINENWESFKDRLRPFDPLWRGRIDFTYDLVKDLFKTLPPRKSGREAFDHARATALILLDECKIKDPRIIIGALAHDVVEDTTTGGYYSGVPYSEGMQTARIRLEMWFGRRIADLIIALTKPRVDGVEILDKEHARVVYFDKLSANPDALLIKMADRLHNLRDYVGLSLGERLEIIRETEIQYFKLFEGARERYPREAEYLLHQMKISIGRIRRSLGNFPEQTSWFSLLSE